MSEEERKDPTGKDKIKISYSASEGAKVELEQNLPAKKRSIIKKILLIAGLIFFSTFVGYFADKLIGFIDQIISPQPGVAKRTKGLKVYAVFPKTPVSRDVLEGLMPSGNDTEILDEGVQLSLHHEYYSPMETANYIFRQLKDDSEIIMVVGHETSTFAKYMIENVYENKAFKNVPIPLILPAVTNPDITDVRANSPNPHILRLPATDDVQVATIISFLEKMRNLSIENKISTSLIVDDTNLEYSTYIAKKLIFYRPELIIDCMGVGLTGNGYFIDRFMMSNPDTFIFIGMKTQADIFINQLIQYPKLGNSRFKQVLFTDGVVSTEFNNTIQRINPSFPVYFTAPMIFEKDMKGLDNEISPVELSYRRIGTLTRLLINRIIKKAATTGHLNREGILHELQKMTERFTLPIANVQYPIWFETQGDNAEASVHLFKAFNKKIYHSKMCDCFTKKTKVPK